MNVLFPISLDKSNCPIATLLRNIAVYNKKINFIGGSSINERRVTTLWARDNIDRFSLFSLLLTHFDIVHHASSTPKNVLAVRLAKLRSLGEVRHIFTANCEPYETDPFLKHYKKSIDRADYVVAVSEAVAAGVKTSFGREVDAVIPNGFDEKTCVLPETYDEQKPFFLFCAQILDRKHPEHFLNLAEHFPDIDFIMAGNIPYPDDTFTKKMLQRIHSLNNVEHIGLISRLDLIERMQQASALIFPSSYEGLPLTVVEAIGCGCPVIAQPKSALPEVIEHGVNGWMFDVEEWSDWVETCESILNRTEAQRREYSATARQSVMEKFRWEVIAESYAKFYKKILK